MVGGKPTEAVVLGDVVQAERPRVADEDAQDAAPARQVADRRMGLGVDAVRDEALELSAGRVDDAERRVAGAGQLGGRLEEPLEQASSVSSELSAMPASTRPWNDDSRSRGCTPHYPQNAAGKETWIPRWLGTAPGVRSGRASRKEDSMKQILIATDGSPSAQEAVEVGLELAKEQGADVTFVHVTDPDEFKGGRGGATPSRTPRRSTTRRRC